MQELRLGNVTRGSSFGRLASPTHHNHPTPSVKHAVLCQDITTEAVSGTHRRHIPKTSSCSPAGRGYQSIRNPPEFWGDPIAVAFDAHTGIPLRVETSNRTEELSNVVLDESFSDDLLTDSPRLTPVSSGTDAVVREPKN